MSERQRERTVLMGVRSPVRPTRPRAVLVLVLALAVSGCPEGGPRDASTLPVLEGPPPNVLLLVADGLGRAALRCHGATSWQTLALDRLADEGTRFDLAFAATATLGPARWSLLTGLWPHEHGARGGRSDPHGRPTTLADTLRDRAGFRTASFARRGGPPAGSEPEAAADLGFGEGTWHALPRGEGFVDAGELAPLLDWLREQAAGRSTPFMAWVDLGGSELWAELTARGLPAAADQQDGLRDEMGRLDGAIRTVLETLDETDLAATTLVVFTSSQGLLATDSYPHDRSRWSEEALAVPMILRQPGRIPAGKARPQLVNHLDLACTMLELCGVAPPLADSRRGSFARLLLLRTQPWRDVVFAEAGGAGLPRVKLARASRWKLVREEGRGESFYDLEQDPTEAGPLPAGTGSAAAERARADLGGRLSELVTESGDGW